MLFDRMGELPVATVRRTSRTKVELVAEGLAQWFVARWKWLRPRTIPVTVAFLGMLAVIQSANYLANPPAARMASASVRIEAPGTMIFVDGQPYLDGQRMPDLASSGYRVRLVLQQ
jgi:hypothetical protein